MTHCHGAATLASANRLLSAFLASFENKPVKVYDINKARPHMIEWADIEPQHFMTTASDKGLFPALSMYNSKLWELFQYSLPPFPGTKYFRVEHDHQMAEDNLPCVALSYMFWIDFFGMAALSAIHKNPLDALGGTKKPSAKKLKSWVESADCTIKIAKMTFKGEYVDDLGRQDTCTKAENFLLEPSMLVQLPWKPVLLHSWLQAALYEIHKFELESLELRHWPLTEDTCALANNLMSSVCKVKERVMLGFAIVNDIISNYSSTLFSDEKCADTILDIVVLPSIPMLEFLLTENVSKIIQNIKDTSFAKSQTEVRSADLLFINFNSYRMMPPLGTLNSDFAFNFNIWTSDVIPNLFPLLTEDIGVIAKKIKNNRPKDTSRETNLVKPMSLDEKYLLALVEKQLKSSSLSPEDRISLTIKAINDRVLEKGYLPTITLNDIKKKFNSAKSKKMAGEIFEKVKFDHVHHAIRQALMYYQAYKMQIGIDTYRSTPAQIIAQQLLILEQEQLARLANTCGLMFHVTPMIPKPTPAKSNSKRKKNKKAKQAAREAAEGEIVKEPPDLPTQFKTASEKQVDRSMLWESLPDEWQEEVDETEEVPGTCQNIHEVIDMLCIKLGRIVHSIAQERFNRLRPYYDWTLIQTLLPSLVRSLVEDPKVLEKAQDFCFFPLIASTIQLYESLHNGYLTKEDLKPESKKAKPKKSKNDDALICQYEEWFVLTKKVTSDINAIIRLLYTFTAGKSKKFREKFKNFCKFIALNYHQMYSAGSLPFRQVFECFQNWHPYVIRFLNSMSFMGNEDYVLAKPGSPMPSYPELGDLYFATEVIMEITTAINMMAPYTTTDNPIPPEISQTDFRFRSLILSHVMLEHRNIKTPDGKRILHLDEDKPTLDIYDLYQILKKWRKGIDEMKGTLHYQLPMCALYPEVKEAVQHFIHGDLEALEECVVIFRDEDSDGEELDPDVLCRNCGKCEGGKKFIVCEKCVEDEYPDVNYYCGKKCKDMWWKTEHMAEHLEFDLGLSDFSHLKAEEEDDDDEWEDESDEELEDSELVNHSENESEDALEGNVVSGDVKQSNEASGITDQSNEASGITDQSNEATGNTRQSNEMSGEPEQAENLVEKMESEQHPQLSNDVSGEPCEATEQGEQISVETERSAENMESDLKPGHTEQPKETTGEGEKSEESSGKSAQVSEETVTLAECSHEAQKSVEILAKENEPAENKGDAVDTGELKESMEAEPSPKAESQVESSETPLDSKESSEIAGSSPEKSEVNSSDHKSETLMEVTSNGLAYSVESCCNELEACKIEQQQKTQMEMEQCNLPVKPETVIST